MNIKDYRPRIIDAQIKARLASTGGILLTGPKWCGKTTTGLFHAKSSVYMDLPENRERYQLAPSLVLNGAFPRLIDEWQDMPSIWDRVRRRIDEESRSGLYILTGSAVPADTPSHTGTGRFARLKMRSMTLFESGDSSGSVSLGDLFDGKPVEPAASDLNYEKAVWLICRGGWPSTLRLSDRRAATDAARDYINALTASDISRVDGVARDPQKVRLLLQSLARTVAAPANISMLRADISAHTQDADVSERSVHSYLNALRQIFVLEEQPAWASPQTLRSKTRIRTTPKRHFTDPSLAAAALFATPDKLARDPETAGLLFESLCIRDLDVYAGALQGGVYHYRADNGLEIDAIVQLDDGRWGAVEVKMGSHRFEEAAASLIKFARKMAECPSMPPPRFLMILCATGGAAATRADGVHIVPLDCLKP
ncbi:MAG: DUF4143 domain-containing protein [Clostridiales bacterium]|nr:DUF4143 domain-containing protein [Clostridiales bacterium]